MSALPDAVVVARGIFNSVPGPQAVLAVIQSLAPRSPIWHSRWCCGDVVPAPAPAVQGKCHPWILPARQSRVKPTCRAGLWAGLKSPRLSLSLFGVGHQDRRARTLHSPVPRLLPGEGDCKDLQLS